MRTAKIGDRLEYALTIKTHLNENDLTVTSDVTSTVKSIDKEFVVDEFEESNVTIDVAGNSIAIPNEGAHRTKTDLTGLVIELTGRQSTSLDYRTQQMRAFLPPTAPVKVGDSWTRELKANPKIGTPTATAQMKFVATEKIGSADCAKVSWTYKETEGTAPCSLEGTVWVRLSDAALMKMDADAKSVPYGDSLPPADMKISLQVKS